MTATEDTLDQASNYDRALGEAEGQYYTLERCLVTHSSGGLFRSHRQIIHVERTYVGIRFDEGEVAGGDGVLCEFQGLTEWVGRTGISYKVEKRESEPGRTRIKVHGERVDEQGVRIGQGGNLILRHHIGPREEPGLTGLAERFTFKLHYPHVMADRSLLAIVSDLQDLVTLGSGRVASFDVLTLLHPDANRERVSGENTRVPFELLAQWTVGGSDEQGSRQQEIFFTLEHLGGLDGVARWLEAAEKHRTSLDRVMATRYAHHNYLADKYLNRLVSLEAFDREAGHSGTYLQRLRRCVEYAGPPISDLVPDTNAWTKRLKDDRNDLAHHLAELARQVSSAQLFLSESAFWLYVVCLLRRAAAPEAVFDGISRTQQFQFLKRRLAKVFEK